MDLKTRLDNLQANYKAVQDDVLYLLNEFNMYKFTDILKTYDKSYEDYARFRLDKFYKIEDGKIFFGDEYDGAIGIPLSAFEDWNQYLIDYKKLIDGKILSEKEESEAFEKEKRMKMYEELKKEFE